MNLASRKLRYPVSHAISYQKDFATFNKFHANAGKKEVLIDLLTEPHTGSWKDSEDEKFTISKDLEFIFIVIANQYSNCIEKTESLKDLLYDKTAKVDILKGSISGKGEPLKIEFTSQNLL
jgi:hypothetical protein